MRVQLVLLLAALNSAPSLAVEVQLRVTRDPRPWDGYPETLGSPVATWVGDELRIRYVANETSTNVIASGPSSVLVSESALTLCYPTEPVSLPSGEPIPAWVGPVLLEFAVNGAPQRDYDISVSADCRSTTAG